MRGAGYDGLTIGIETADDEALRFMDKGYLAADILEQCGRLDKAGIRYSFFYLTGISGAGRGEDGARITAAVCNQLHPALVGANMLTICPDSRLYGEIRQGNCRCLSRTYRYGLTFLPTQVQIFTRSLPICRRSGIPWSVSCSTSWIQ